LQKVLHFLMNYVGTGVEWDEDKNEQNKKDHEGLGFELAQLVFADPERIERLDQSENNTSGEERWQTLGKVGEVLFVVYTERGANKRLISARVADKSERRSYNGYYKIDGKHWTKAD
jgi:uncharacterized DUF497 family protein